MVGGGVIFYGGAWTQVVGRRHYPHGSRWRLRRPVAEGGMEGTRDHPWRCERQHPARPGGKLIVLYHLIYSSQQRRANNSSNNNPRGAVWTTFAVAVFFVRYKLLRLRARRTVPMRGWGRKRGWVRRGVSNDEDARPCERQHLRYDGLTNLSSLEYETTL